DSLSWRSRSSFRSSTANPRSRGVPPPPRPTANRLPGPDRHHLPLRAGGRFGISKVPSGGDGERYAPPIHRSQRSTCCAPKASEPGRTPDRSSSRDRNSRPPPGVGRLRRPARDGLLGAVTRSRGGPLPAGRQLLAEDLTQPRLGHWTVGLGEILAERLVHHRLIARSGALGALPEGVQDRVVDEDGDPRLPLLRDQSFALATGEIVFSPHSL